MATTGADRTCCCRCFESAHMIHACNVRFAALLRAACWGLASTYFAAALGCFASSIVAMSMVVFGGGCADPPCLMFITARTADPAIARCGPVAFPMRPCHLGHDWCRTYVLLPTLGASAHVLCLPPPLCGFTACGLFGFSEHVLYRRAWLLRYEHRCHKHGRVWWWLNLLIHLA